MKLITVTGAQGRAGDAKARHRVHDRIVAPDAGQDQILVEWGFHSASVGSSNHGVGTFDVIGDAKTRLCLPGDAEAIVEIAAEPEVQGPVLDRDGVLEIHGEFLDICPATIQVLAASRVGTAIGGRQLSGSSEVVAGE